MAGEDDEQPETIEAASPTMQPTVDVATKRGRTRQERELVTQEQERTVLWRTILSTVVGRREIWNILAAAHPFEIKFGLGPSGVPDPQATFMAMGEQQFGLRWFFKLQVLAPGEVAQMLLENDPRFKKVETPSRTKKSDAPSS